MSFFFSNERVIKKESKFCLLERLILKTVSLQLVAVHTPTSTANWFRMAKKTKRLGRQREARRNNCQERHKTAVFLNKRSRVVIFETITQRQKITHKHRHWRFRNQGLSDSR